MELLNMCDLLDKDAKETFLKVRNQMLKMRAKVKEIIGTIEDNMRFQVPIEELNAIAKANSEYFDESLSKTKECARLLECISMFNAGTFHQPQLQDQPRVNSENLSL